MSTQVEEWRVTGQPSEVRGKKGEPVVEFRPYSFTWTTATLARHARADEDTPEKAARGFIARTKASGHPWIDGPHLHRRTVTYTDWEEIKP